MGIAADTRRYFLFFVRLHTPKEHPDAQYTKLVDSLPVADSKPG
jgi:hypothetical protein